MALDGSWGGYRELAKRQTSNFTRSQDPFSSLAKSLGGGEGQEMPYKPAEIDPNLEKLAQSQKDQANAFQSQKGQIGADKFGLAAESGRSGLAQQMAGIKRNYGGRGLLYSGLKQGAQSGAKGGMASQLAAAQGDINQGLEKQGQEMDLTAADTGMKVRDMKQQIENQKYADAMQRWQLRRQQDEGFGQFTQPFTGAFGGARY